MKSGYNTYRGWIRIEYQNKHYNINQKDEGTWDNRGRDGGTNFILRIKEQETHLTLQEHDDDDDDDDDIFIYSTISRGTPEHVPTNPVSETLLMYCCPMLHPKRKYKCLKHRKG